MSRPTDQLARPGDIVRLDEVDDYRDPGLVVKVDTPTGWCLVQWYDPHVEGLIGSWEQWHPVRTLAVISRG